MSTTAGYIAYSGHLTCNEVQFLENVWRQSVMRARFVTAALALYSVLPLDMIRHIVYSHYAGPVTVSAVSAHSASVRIYRI
jgi:hypothetical protein